MSRTWLITPAFAKAALLEDCLKWIYRPGKDPRAGVTHVIIDNHYPVDKDANRTRIKELAYTYSCAYVDSGGDLGLHEGINNAAKRLFFEPNDIVVGCDPDDRPSDGFVERLSGAIHGDPNIAVAAAFFSVIDQRLKEGVFKQGSSPTGDSETDWRWVHPTVEMWNVAAFNWKFISEIGGLKQPHAYYGGLESYLHSQWAPRGMKLVYMPSVRSDCAPVDRNDPRLFDPEYREWKTAHLNGFKGSFEMYLALNGSRGLVQ